jgi:hypothetical protein
VKLTLGPKVAMFEKLGRLGQHMKPLFIKGYIEGKPLQRIMVDDGVGMNVMPWATFEELGYLEKELMRTNTSLSVFTCDVMEARGVLSVELTISSKTLATAFFVVDVKGWYNLLLRRDWIHANGCVPSTLHQCLIQWVSDMMEVVVAEHTACVATTEAHVGSQVDNMTCLSGWDLSEYVYISVNNDGIMPVNVKPNERDSAKRNRCRMMSKEDSSEWLRWRTKEYCSRTKDISDVVEDLGHDGKLGQGFSSLDQLEEMDIRDGVVPRPKYVNANVPIDQKEQVCHVLCEFSDFLHGNIPRCSGLGGN